MTWSGAGAVLAILMSAGALWVAILARRDTKRSADADEAAVALARQEAEERRLAALPRPEFVLERRGQSGYVLRNVGTGPANGVQILDDGLPPATRNLPIPAGTTLLPGAGYSFVMAGSSGGRIPTHVMVTWLGSAGPVAVSIPRLG